MLFQSLFGKKIKNIHIIGISGISMSAIAEILIGYNYTVTGSDLILNENSKKLKTKGVKIFLSHKPSNVLGSDLVIYSSAIDDMNVELVEAKKQSIPCLNRAVVLNEISKNYENVIAISGSHGKTTCTAMIGKIFLEAGLNPTIHLGGNVDYLDGNALVNFGKYFITEACEYKKNFLMLKPTIGVVLNIDLDHMECYKTYKNIRQAFKEFESKSQNGYVCRNDCVLDVSKKYTTVGLDGDAEWIPMNINIHKDGTCSFDAYQNNKFMESIKLNIIGIYNVYNALVAIAVARLYNIEFKVIKKALANFNGVKRRAEKIGEINSSIVIHDYAHHPQEINSIISSVKSFYTGEIIVVFEPHTYSRTLLLKQEFINCFNMCDELILLPTYPAREKEIIEGKSEDLFNEIIKHKPNTKFINSYHKAKKYLIKKSNAQNCMLILGAGDIKKLARIMIK